MGPCIFKFSQYSPSEILEKLFELCNSIPKVFAEYLPLEKSSDVENTFHGNIHHVIFVGHDNAPTYIL